MKKIALFIAILASGYAFAATAYFTGNQRHVTSAVDGSLLLQCEYAYGSFKTWITTRALMCPMSIEVE